MQDFIQVAAIAELLGQLWLHEPSQETLDSMATAEFRDAWEPLGGFVPTRIDGEIVEQLAVEYCSLLVGPKQHFSPVQSVWARQQFQADTASSMRKFIDLLPGYAPASNLTDHLGVQLDFLSQLLKNHLRRPEDRVVVNEIVPQFVNSHLLWTESLLDQIRRSARSDFYAGVANVTERMIRFCASEFPSGEPVQVDVNVV